ncbi:MAG: toxin-antitoxin system YwqK family antitoxin [Bacteroidetes bacterium]|nr:toxin-antitoxin system YwqK family antitoxin [Bacteroidota bacterium]
MKVLSFLFSFILLININSFAQEFEIIDGDTINRLDNNNQKQGLWVIIKKETGRKSDEGLYKNNKKNGVWKKYYKSGTIKSAITYLNNLPTGYAKFYYANGNVSEEGIWKINKWTGHYKYYFENGNVAYDWNYNKSGKRTGTQKYYHDNGTLMIEGDWTNGKEAGALKEYYADGSLKSEKNFADGKLDETSVKHYKKQENKAIITKQSKSKESVKMFTGNGYFKLNNKSKKVDREGEFSNGRLVDGKRYFYNNNGELIKTSIYKNGKLIQNIDNLKK